MTAANSRMAAKGPPANDGNSSAFAAKTLLRFLRRSLRAKTGVSDLMHDNTPFVAKVVIAFLPESRANMDCTAPRFGPRAGDTPIREILALPIALALTNECDVISLFAFALHATRQTIGTEPDALLLEAASKFVVGRDHVIAESIKIVLKCFLLIRTTPLEVG